MEEELSSEKVEKSSEKVIEQEVKKEQEQEKVVEGKKDDTEEETEEESDNSYQSDVSTGGGKKDEKSANKYAINKLELNNPVVFKQKYNGKAYARYCQAAKRHPILITESQLKRIFNEKDKVNDMFGDKKYQNIQDINHLQIYKRF